MKFFFSLVLISACIFSVSCSSHLSPPSPASPLSYKASPESRVLIKTGTMRLQVNDVKLASKQASDLTKKHKGYIESVDSSDDKGAYARLELRIPKQDLVPMMDGLAAMGKVTSSNVQIEDVTGQWIDLQAKIKNLRALRDRLRKLLQEAKNVKETLEVEKELTRVQSELDSLEGKIKAMQKHVTYSKLSVRISQKSMPGPLGVVGKSAWWGVKKLFVLR